MNRPSVAGGRRIRDQARKKKGKARDREPQREEKSTSPRFVLQFRKKVASAASVGIWSKPTGRGVRKK